MILSTLDRYTNNQASILWQHHFLKGNLVTPKPEWFDATVMINKNEDYPQISYRG